MFCYIYIFPFFSGVGEVRQGRGRIPGCEECLLSGHPQGRHPAELVPRRNAQGESESDAEPIFPI